MSYLPLKWFTYNIYSFKNMLTQTIHLLQEHFNKNYFQTAWIQEDLKCLEERQAAKYYYDFESFNLDNNKAYRNEEMDKIYGS